MPIRQKSEFIMLPYRSNTPVLNHMYLQPYSIRAQRWVQAHRVPQNPFPSLADHLHFAVSGTPEVWEYEIRGVLNDEEIGQPSARMSLAYAG